MSVCMEALDSTNISTQPLDHLGLISAVVQDLGLEEKIDVRLPINSEMGASVSMGKRVHAMILNGLGFINTRLYMFSKFFENKPLTRLLGPGIKAEHLNDDAIGRCLDTIYEYGCTKFYSEIASSVAIEQNLLGKSAHYDTTTINVEGKYDIEENNYKETKEENKKQPPTITYGYSKDHRHDLKQLTLLLTTTGKAGIPIWMEGLDGNASDKKSMRAAAERVQAFYKVLEGTPDFLHIFDSAYYDQNIANSDKMLWITRVPETLSEAKKLVERSEEEMEWTDVGDGYKIATSQSSYGNVLQRWVLIFSQKGYNREIKTLEKQIAKEKIEIENALWHLENKKFSCEEDARKSLGIFKKLKFHTVEGQPESIFKHASRGRPKEGIDPKVVGYKVIGKVLADEGKIKMNKLKKGRFILSTNQMDCNILPNLEILQEYKKQSQPEQGFKLIKSDDFQISSVYLKKPERIEALMVVMTICLMIYNIAQHRLRVELEANNEVLPGPENRPLKKPTFNAVAKMFHGVSVVCIILDKTKGVIQELVSNIGSILRKIIKYFGPKAELIYGIT